jgi:hypothetical protein
MHANVVHGRFERERERSVRRDGEFGWRPRVQECLIERPTANAQSRRCHRILRPVSLVTSIVRS